jgi:hypothetical protein
VHSDFLKAVISVADDVAKGELWGGRAKFLSEMKIFNFQRIHFFELLSQHKGN